MSDDERAAFDNGIWLCSNCHTMIDKNQGDGYSVTLLREWKTDHESVIHSLLQSHKSPLPLLRKFTEEGRVAQDVINILEQHGVLFAEMIYEVPPYMIESLVQLRSDLQALLKELQYDTKLKTLIKDLAGECRGYMNRTGNFPSFNSSELETLRNRVAVAVMRLRSEYGCTVQGPLAHIGPS